MVDRYRSQKFGVNLLSGFRENGFRDGRMDKTEDGGTTDGRRTPA